METKGEEDVEAFITGRLVSGTASICDQSVQWITNPGRNMEESNFGFF